MSFKFEKLEVWQLSLAYLVLIHKIAAKLPKNEEYNLKLQMIRAATSINLNIAEGSTSQTDAEQARFVGLAIRSVLETVACQHIIHQLNYLKDKTDLREAYRQARLLVAKLHNLRKSLIPEQSWLREAEPVYFSNLDDQTPFDD
ncbi:MAG: four helix bundle protein [Caldilineales bacterium]|nr:four helix bundle protein [Caldilineales bacterium]